MSRECVGHVSYKLTAFLKGQIIVRNTEIQAFLYYFSLSVLLEKEQKKKEETAGSLLFIGF